MGAVTDPTDPTPPPSAPRAPAARCCVCEIAYARKVVELDGLRRCFAHSTDPDQIAKRKEQGKHGVKGGVINGDNVRGIPHVLREVVRQGLVTKEAAKRLVNDRDLAAEAMREKYSERATAVEQVRLDLSLPVPLDDQAKVLAYLARVAGKLEAGADSRYASAASTIARAALAALGIETKEVDEAGDAPRGFTYATTAGEVVPVRGRDDDPVH